MKRRSPHIARRRPRLECIEARRVLSASLGELEFWPDSSLLGATYLAPTGEGTVPLTTDTAIVAIDGSSSSRSVVTNELGYQFWANPGSTIGSQLDVLFGSVWSIVVADINGSGLTSLDPDLQGIDRTGDPFVSEGGDFLGFDSDGFDTTKASGDVGDGSLAAQDSGSDGASDTQPAVPLPVSDSPFERASTTQTSLQRVTMAMNSAASIDAPGAGAIDLAMLLLQPGATSSTDAPMAPSFERPVGPVASRDADLAVESWARSLPSPPSVGSVESVSQGPIQPAVEAKARPVATPAPIPEPPRDANIDRVSVRPAAEAAPATDERTAPQRWEERFSRPYAWVAVALVSGLVWVSRRYDPGMQHEFLEHPPRKSSVRQ